MVRRFRPSPALVIAMIALFVSLGGFSYAAADRIGTRQIANGAITAKKLHRGAVKTKKIHNSAVTASKLANGAVTALKTATTIVKVWTAGLPVAGVNVAPNGAVRRYFNRYGGSPTVNHPSAGFYQIVFPGLVGKVGGKTALTTATLVSDLGEIRATSASGNALVKTGDSAGKPANRGFDLVVVLRTP
jgi:hypothetical protein